MVQVGQVSHALRKHAYNVYNFDPLTPHLYIVKLGFTEVYIIFLISAQKHRMWVLVEAVLMSTHNLCFEQQYEKYQKFLSEKFQFFGGKIFSIFDFHNGYMYFNCPAVTIFFPIKSSPKLHQNIIKPFA